MYTYTHRYIYSKYPWRSEVSCPMGILGMELGFSVRAYPPFQLVATQS